MLSMLSSSLPERAFSMPVPPELVILTMFALCRRSYVSAFRQCTAVLRPWPLSARRTAAERARFVASWRRTQHVQLQGVQADLQAGCVDALHAVLVSLLLLEGVPGEGLAPAQAGVQARRRRSKGACSALPSPASAAPSSSLVCEVCKVCEECEVCVVCEVCVCEVCELCVQRAAPCCRAMCASGVQRAKRSATLR